MKHASTRRDLGRRAAVLAMGGALPALLPPRRAWAQGLATHPVSVIVPYSPGAPPDTVARVLGEALQRRWGQPFVVDNRPGASGVIGTQAVARAAPDGSTLLLSSGGIAINVSLFRNVPYDPVRDLAPIAQLATFDFALLGNSTAGATMQEFVERARRNPGQLNYATPGIGTPHHLAMELLKRRTGIEIEHVPYRGLPGATSDLLAGHVAVMFNSVSASVELARDGRVRLLAVAAETRAPQAPATPTMAEAGVTGMIANDWYAFFAPAGTPPGVIQRYNEALNAVLVSPEVREVLANQGVTPLGGAPELLRDRLAADLVKWAGVIREAGIVAE